MGRSLISHHLFAALFRTTCSHDTVVLHTTFPAPIRLIVLLQGYLRQSKPNKQKILTNFKPMFHINTPRKDQQTKPGRFCLITNL